VDDLDGRLNGYGPDDFARTPIASENGRPIYLYSTDSPLRSTTGELERMALFAGQVCGAIDDVPTAGERIARIVNEAVVALARLNAAVGEDHR
jgi:nitronate monooxygenase